MEKKTKKATVRAANKVEQQASQAKRRLEDDLKGVTAEDANAVRRVWKEMIDTKDPENFDFSLAGRFSEYSLTPPPSFFISHLPRRVLLENLRKSGTLMGRLFPPTMTMAGVRVIAKMMTLLVTSAGDLDASKDRLYKQAARYAVYGVERIDFQVLGEQIGAALEQILGGTKVSFRSPQPPLLT